MIHNTSSYNSALASLGVQGAKSYLIQLYGQPTRSPYFKQDGDNFRCNFGPGYGDILQSLAYCINHKRPCTLTYYNSYNLNSKIKPSDPETVGERFLYIKDNMIGNNVTVKFVPSTNPEGYLGFEQFTDPLPQWYFKDMWVGGDYVTVQLMEPQLKHTEYTDWRIVPTLESLVQQLPYKLVFLSYDTPIEQAHSLLKNARCHIGYSGSTTHLAMATGTPTIVVCNDKVIGSFSHPGAFCTTEAGFLEDVADLDNIIKDCDKYIKQRYNELL